MARNFPRFFEDRTNVFPRIAAEGQFVFVEHRLSARLSNGRNYSNDYCFAYEVKDGQVVAIREYMDTRGGWVQVFGDREASQLIEYL
ncbi:nuclear transport factor 2 family protein [Paraburkholderia sp. CNPSo 3274]|nr:nuclear transport factor 2 family protein [Paraburkholderia sp. CNPSo 3274]